MKNLFRRRRKKESLFRHGMSLSFSRIRKAKESLLVRKHLPNESKRVLRSAFSLPRFFFLARSLSLLIPKQQSITPIRRRRRRRTTTTTTIKKTDVFPRREIHLMFRENIMRNSQIHANHRFLLRNVLTDFRRQSSVHDYKLPTTLVCYSLNPSN